VSGTVRMLDRGAWDNAEEMVRTLVEQVVAPTGATVDVEYGQGVPPVDNDPTSTAIFQTGVQSALGPKAVADTEQSLGGEDFSWYLEHVPGAMARLGVRAPGDTAKHDLHRGDFDVDESAIAVGVEFFTAAALLDGRRARPVTQPIR
jgi:metal-dependent amidase/aminoacylase/carboxypeptidase family protein